MWSMARMGENGMEGRQVESPTLRNDAKPRIPSVALLQLDGRFPC